MMRKTLLSAKYPERGGTVSFQAPQLDLDAEGIKCDSEYRKTFLDC